MADPIQTPGDSGVGIVSSNLPGVKLGALEQQLTAFADQALKRIDMEATQSSIARGKTDQATVEAVKRDDAGNIIEGELKRKKDKILFGQKYVEAYNIGAKQLAAQDINSEFKRRAEEMLLDLEVRAEVDPAAYAERVDNAFQATVEVMNDLDPSGGLVNIGIDKLNATAEAYKTTAVANHVQFKLDQDELRAKDTLNDQLIDSTDLAVQSGATEEGVQKLVDDYRENIDKAYAVHRIGKADRDRLHRQANDTIVGDYIEAKVRRMANANQFVEMNELFDRISAGEFFENNKFPDRVKAIFDEKLTGYTTGAIEDFHLWGERTLAGQLPQNNPDGTPYDISAKLNEAENMADMLAAHGKMPQSTKLQKEIAGARRMMAADIALKNNESTDELFREMSATNTYWNKMIGNYVNNKTKEYAADLANNSTNIAVKTNVVSPLSNVINRALIGGRDVKQAVRSFYSGKDVLGDIKPNTPEFQAILDGENTAINPDDVGAYWKNIHVALSRVPEGTDIETFAEGELFKNIISDEAAQTILDARKAYTNNPYDPAPGNKMTNADYYTQLEDGLHDAMVDVADKMSGVSRGALLNIFYNRMDAVSKTRNGSDMRIERSLRDVSFSIGAFNVDIRSNTNSLNEFRSVSRDANTKGGAEFQTFLDGQQKVVETSNDIRERVDSISSLLSRDTADKNAMIKYFNDAAIGMYVVGIRERKTEGDINNKIVSTFATMERQIDSASHQFVLESTFPDTQIGSKTFIPVGNYDPEQLNFATDYVFQHPQEFGLDLQFVGEAFSQSQPRYLDGRIEFRSLSGVARGAEFSADKKAMAFDLSPLEDPETQDDLRAAIVIRDSFSSTDKQIKEANQVISRIMKDIVYTGKLPQESPRDFLKWRAEKADR